MKDIIAVSPEVRRLNAAVEQADSLCPLELGPRKLVEWLYKTKFYAFAFELQDAWEGVELIGQKATLD